MKLFINVVFLTVSLMANPVHAGDIRTDFSGAVWDNMLDIPEVLVRSKDAAKFTDTDVCFQAGQLSKQVTSNLLELLRRLSVDGNRLSKSIGYSNYNNTIAISNAVKNLAVELAARCRVKLNRDALNTDLVRMYRGHIALYRIITPSDIGRALNGLNDLKELLSPSEINLISSPPKNTGEIGAGISRDLE